MNIEALADAILKYQTEGMDLRAEDAKTMANDMAEWSRTTGCDLDREIVAHDLWTMGGSIKHKKCYIESDPYENGCPVCQTHLRAVADSILLAAVSTSTGSENSDD